MRAANQIPKLGSVQRWVRDCDAVGEASKELYPVLDAILRAASPSKYDLVDKDERGSATLENVEVADGSPCYSSMPPVLLHTRFTSRPLPPSSLSDDETIRNSFDIVSHQKASERVPPNRFDMTIYRSQPSLFPLLPHPNVTSVPLRSIPSSYAISDVLLPQECANIIAATESLGYLPDEPTIVGSSLLSPVSPLSSPSLLSLPS